MPKLPRTASWKPQDGNGVALIQAALNPFLDKLLVDNGKVYTSENMRKGFDKARLELHAPMLASLLQLDKRGGYFAQTDLMQALSNIQATNKEWSNKVEAKAKDVGRSSFVMKARMGYYIRVMFAHLRSRRKSHKPGDDADGLGPLYETMERPSRRARSAS